jgi:uncharacterized membrane protein
MSSQPSRLGSGRTERVLHQSFELGVLLKGIDGAVELAGGLLLLFLSPKAIGGIVLFFISEELLEDPTDLFANLLLNSSRSLLRSRNFAIAFLLVHGIAKLLLVGGLSAGKLWSYPAAIVVFGGFMVYQVFELSHRFSFFLTAVTLLDAIVIVLIYEEYQHRRTAGR